MKYLFISGLYPKQQEDYFIQNSRSYSIQNAPNVFQWCVVDGLDKNEIDYWVLSAPFIASFPKGFKRFVIPDFPITMDGRIVGRSLRYYNLVGLKALSVRKRVEKGIRDWIKANSIKKDEKFSIISYTPLSFFLSAAKSIKKEYPNMILCSIVTDLVEDAHNFKVNDNPLKKVQLAIEQRNERRNFKVVDKFVLLSKAMIERIPEAEDKSIIVEGIAVVEEKECRYDKSVQTRSLLYTGSLHEFAGIKTLVNAFQNTSNKDFRLVICGKGPCEDFVKTEAQKDTRIVFLGSIKREDAIREQHKATALINPRPPIEEITRFSFPSKTMEYLSSGTPMIGYRLEGIPEDYYDFFFSPSSVGLNELTETINKVLSMDSEDLGRYGERAFRFIRDNKNSKVQVGKIINFIENE